jgi:uncharacterized LabA/DUF88 family protein
MAQQGGFEVKVHNRDYVSGKEKAVDTELTMQGTSAIYETPTPAVLVIASADRDFIPLVNKAHEKGWSVEMVAFGSAFRPDGLMATSVDRVRSLDGSLDLIGHCEFEWPEKFE